ncbi:MAG: hypothetical protein CMF49_08325 [Legionellales bacterium]|nr:hypothetical protein [Legionellales bacterium]
MLLMSNNFGKINSNTFKCKFLLLMTILSCLNTIALAGTENRLKIWAGFEIENSIKSKSKWYYNFFTQSQFVNNQLLIAYYLDVGHQLPKRVEKCPTSAVLSTHSQKITRIVVNK